MDGQAPPPADAVVPELVTVAETDPRPPPPLEAEDFVPEAGVLPPVESEAEDVVPVVSEAFEAASPEASDSGAGGVVLTDELRAGIVKQVEYYFSDENLRTDEFLMKIVKKNKQGFVPIRLIASFRRMKKLVQDLSIIEAALRTSSKLVVSSDGKRIRRLHPLPHNEFKDAKERTVVVENLPSDFSMESIHMTFETVGRITEIIIHDQHSVGESATTKKPDIMLSNKVHALIEYETAEAAEKAVTTFNDVRNWRTGMKVRLAKQIYQFKEDALNKENENSDVSHEDMCQHQKINAKGGQRGRYRGKGRGQNQQNTSGQGHGSSPCSSGSDYVNKTITGPRMPDGTRGFTMGRGKSHTLQKDGNAEE
ncbi:hypothetical protein GUJ93_ZPchr0007g3643 [Zizania palustris]|uniref:La-related protein 6A n=1 Tax=Zizania palustris TaxID=103762 RepID=A0A8J5T0Q3_ZIZPA|nr:hypothetical protein GUJ93_ZPchr0007g3643 [Zizania palustris]